MIRWPSVLARLSLVRRGGSTTGRSSRTPPAPAVDRGALPWLYLAALATTAPHALHQPFWLSTLAALVLAWAGWLWWRDLRLPGRWGLVLLVAAGCAGILAEFRTLFGREAGVSMLALFMAMKLLELRSRRDGLVVVILGYFLLLTHYLYAQTLLTGGWLLAATWGLTACLVRLQAGPALPPAAVLRQAGLLVAQALPFMLVLFVLFPRISGPLWGLPQDAHAGRTGLSDSMAPGTLSELVQNGAVAFRVRFDGPPPGRRQLYWRGPVLETYDGMTWRPATARTDPERIEASAPPLAYETTLEPHQQRWLLALDAPHAWPDGARTDGRLTLLDKQPVHDRKRLRLNARLDYRFNIDESPRVLTRNLALPPHGNPRARALAASWQASSTPAERVAQALRLFSEEPFIYTLRPPRLGNDPVDDFLFITRRGFCEHYAAAFVFLMRAAGVPARVVTGYQGGEQNPIDGYLIVRQSDAHAWAEVWLAGQGWVRVDPTAAVSPDRIEQGIADALPDYEPLPLLIQIRTDWLLGMRYRWEALNNAWNQHILGYDDMRQRQLLRRLGWPEADWQTLARLLAVTCGALASLVLWWAMRRHRAAADPAHRLWERALRQLRRRQVDYAPWETPLTLAARVRDTHPEWSPAFERVVDTYLHCRYGPGPQDLAALKAAVRLWTR